MIYLDYNATTPLCDVAREAMLPYLDRHFGNPSSVHAAGRETRAAIDNARDKLAALLGVKPTRNCFHQRRHRIMQSRRVRPGALSHATRRSCDLSQDRTSRCTKRDRAPGKA